MPTKAEVLATLSSEVAIANHLASKLKPEHLGYRLSACQRSTQELLDYMAVSNEAVTDYFLTGGWAKWESLAAERKNLTPAGFIAANSQQMANITSALANISESEFQTRLTKDFAGTEITLAKAYAELIVKFTIGYKMQLFLQAKAAGLSELSTDNVWFGRDPKPKAAAAT